MSTETIRAAVCDAIASRETIRIAGAGSWMNAGRPVQAHQTVSLTTEKGIVDYVPDDLTITVRAGTTHEEIAAATRANGQWLPLDPPGASIGAIGATIAIASSGPLAHGSGFARDFILGLEFVTGKGDVVRSGGRVVKNVAGFDLMRLMCGSWGTLGVITQATLRLYALPKVDRTFAIAAPEGRDALDQFAELLTNAPLTALSMELVNGALAAGLGLPPKTTVLIRLGGNATLVEAQLETLRGFGSPADVGAEVWTRLSDLCSAPAVVALRLSGLPANVGAMWWRAEQILDGDGGGYIHSTFSRGIVRLMSNESRANRQLPRPAPSVRVTFEVLPSDLWKIASPTVVSDRLSSSVKHAFDPHTLLNPGILG